MTSNVMILDATTDGTRMFVNTLDMTPHDPDGPAGITSEEVLMVAYSGQFSRFVTLPQNRYYQGIEWHDGGL